MILESTRHRKKATENDTIHTRFAVPLVFFNMKGLYQINQNQDIMHAIPKMICYWPTPELVDKRFLGIFKKATENREE